MCRDPTEDESRRLREHTVFNSIVKKYFAWVPHISVEPTMWLYMMAFMITSVVEQQLFFYKACRVNHGLSEEVCENKTLNKTIKQAIQLTVSDFHQWNGIAGHVVPIILALFLGNWSDRHGRKLPLLIGLISKTIYSAMIVINILMPHWDLFMIIYTATIPMGMLCGDVAIFASCFAYISDVSTFKQRTFRVTILDIVYLSTMPIGVSLGSYLFDNVFHRSYAIMFIINTSLLVLSMIYSLIVLKWQTNPRQKSIPWKNALTDFFDKEHIKATMETLTKKRPQFRRYHLWILFLTMALYTFQRDETPMSFLYTQRMFQWGVAEFSKFKTFRSTLFVIVMLLGAPTLSRVFGLRDTYIVAIGALSHATGRVLFAFAKTPQVFYAGAAVAAFGPIIAPVLRSMTSKIVPSTERGKVFAILSVCDNAVPLFSGVLYTQLFNAEYDRLPSAIYWLTFSTQLAVLLLILIIRITSKSNQEEVNECEVEKSCLSDESNGNNTKIISTCVIMNIDIIKKISLRPGEFQ